MTSNPESHDHEQKAGITRRTVVKGAAWAAPVIAVAAVVPDASASLPPCVGSVATAGGTYPVNVGLGGCNVSGTHWDFTFKIGALANVGCNCAFVEVTFKDTPNRSQLWLNQNSGEPQRYVRKVLAIGATGTFPAQGDQVRNVVGDQLIGTIQAPGQTQDSLHTLINTAGTGTPPCGVGDIAMATYEVKCGQSANGPFTPFPGGAGIGSINICVPLIQVTSVCRTDSTGNDRFRFSISVANSCGIGAGSFVVTNIQRNDDSNFPNEGSSVWSGSQAVGVGTQIAMTSTGSGSQFWISYTTDGGLNTSRIRYSLPGGVNNCP